MTFLVAGHETVASALTWALVLLGTHPDIADRVAKEADEVLGLPAADGSQALDMPDIGGRHGQPTSTCPPSPGSRSRGRSSTRRCA